MTNAVFISNGLRSSDFNGSHLVSCRPGGHQSVGIGHNRQCRQPPARDEQVVAGRVSDGDEGAVTGSERTGHPLVSPVPAGAVRPLDGV